MDLDVSVFGLKTANGTPKLVNEDYFVFFNHLKTTDGENNDTAKFQNILRYFRSKNIYIQIVGIGNANLSYVKQIADAEPNVGFCQIADVRKLSDEQMMEQLVQTEFVEWIKKF